MYICTCLSQSLSDNGHSQGTELLHKDSVVMIKGLLLYHELSISFCTF